MAACEWTPWTLCTVYCREFLRNPPNTGCSTESGWSQLTFFSMGDATEPLSGRAFGG